MFRLGWKKNLPHRRLKKAPLKRFPKLQGDEEEDGRKVDVMTRAELITLITAYAGEDYKPSQDALIASICDDAIEEVRNVRYPFGQPSESQCEEVMERFASNIRRIAEYHYDKIGKEGVTTFYESGQTTSWESGGTPDSFFRGIIPIAKLV